MNGRSRLQYIVLFLIVFSALLVVGCGGGGGGDETTAAGSTSRTTQPSGSGTTGSTLSNSELLKIVDELPQEFVDAYGNRAIVVLFYVPGSVDDTSVLETVTRLRSAFSQYVFLLYDYKNPEAYGTLSQLLEVSYPPYLVLIDKAGYPRNVITGYVDEGTLNQMLVNLANQ